MLPKNDNANHTEDVPAGSSVPYYCGSTCVCVGGGGGELRGEDPWLGAFFESVSLSGMIWPVSFTRVPTSKGGSSLGAGPRSASPGLSLGHSLEGAGGGGSVLPSLRLLHPLSYCSLSLLQGVFRRLGTLAQYRGPGRCHPCPRLSGKWGGALSARWKVSF